jgi:NAD(P)-dependent dehydrogenase (short-subunit alcohol dehydrogenase family)
VLLLRCEADVERVIQEATAEQNLPLYAYINSAGIVGRDDMKTTSLRLSLHNHTPIAIVLFYSSPIGPRQVSSTVCMPNHLLGFKFPDIVIGTSTTNTTGALGPIAMMDEESFRKTVDVHLLGTFFGIKHAAR